MFCTVSVSTQIVLMQKEKKKILYNFLTFTVERIVIFLNNLQNLKFLSRIFTCNLKPVIWKVKKSKNKQVKTKGRKSRMNFFIKHLAAADLVRTHHMFSRIQNYSFLIKPTLWKENPFRTDQWLIHGIRTTKIFGDTLLDAFFFLWNTFIFLRHSFIL